MKHLITALSLVALSTGPALSLSCMRPDVVRSYTAAAGASEAYLVVAGTLTHDVAAVPTGRNSDTPPVTFEAQLKGHLLKADGFTGAVDLPVTVKLECLNVWCADLPAQNGKVLAFVQKRSGGYLLDLLPCLQWLHTDPAQADLDRIVACHTKGECEELN